MTEPSNQDDILFTRKDRIRARVSDTLTDGATQLSARQADVSPFFLTDHNFGGADGPPAPMLVVLADRPFVLAAKAPAPRGLTMELTVSSSSGARVVARATSFSTAVVDAPSEVRLDRWDDGSHAALVVGDALAAERDGQGAVSTRAAAHVTVTPLITVDAAGVRWKRKGPLWPMDRARRLAAALAKLPPSDRMYEDVGPEDLDRLLADVEDIVAGLGALDRLGATSVGSPPRPLAAAAMTGAGGSPGAVSVLRHGDGAALSPEDALPFRVVEAGRESAWPLRFLACRNAAEMEFLRQVRPAK